MSSLGNQNAEQQLVLQHSESELNSMNAGQQRPSRKRVYKIYTSTFKTLQQTSYHLATFNSILQAPGDLPQPVRMEVEDKSVAGGANGSKRGGDQGAGHHNQEEFKDVYDMIKKENKRQFGKQFEPSSLQQPGEIPLHKPQAQKFEQQTKLRDQKYVFEENFASTGQTAGGNFEKIVYKGFDSAQFAGTYKLEQKEDPKVNNFKSANYALMMYDKKRDAFRMVPIQRHIFFEKQKNKEQKESKPVAKPRMQIMQPTRGGKKPVSSIWKTILDRNNKPGAKTKLEKIKNEKNDKKKKKGGDEDGEEYDAPAISDIDDNEEFHKHVQGYEDEQGAAEEVEIQDFDNESDASSSIYDEIGQPKPHKKKYFDKARENQNDQNKNQIQIKAGKGQNGQTNMKNQDAGPIDDNFMDQSVYSGEDDDDDYGNDDDDDDDSDGMSELNFQSSNHQQVGQKRGGYYNDDVTTTNKRHKK